MAGMAAIANSDNPELSQKRPRRHRDPSEMTAMVRRVSAAMVRRASAGDLEALESLAAMRDHVDQAIHEAAAELHESSEWDGGFSWTVIGQTLGISRQAARQRFSKEQSQ